MNKDITLKIDNLDISVKEINEQEYISLTDIARLKSEEPKDVIKNWMRLKNTIQLLGFWETKHNLNFKGVEFDSFKNQAGFEFTTICSKLKCKRLKVNLIG